MNGRVGWVTTWNIKCGIAGYVKHLLECVPSNDFIIFAAKNEAILGPDPPNCIRCWTSDKEFNGLQRVAEELELNSINAVVVQFNYGFFNHVELNGFIQGMAKKGIRVFIDLHATIDPFEVPNFRIIEFLPALRECCRILAHGPDDMNRLKALGLVDNVMLFPHAIVDWPKRNAARVRSDETPLVASFGFCFANKGLPELVEAVHLLRQQGIVIRLRMLNAQHENPESAMVVMAVRKAIETYGLQDDVEFRTEFLDDDVCLELLSEADLVVNSYQRTGESASGAVRFGLASHRPVLVTPLTIFDDLGDAVFRTKSTTPADIASGIAETLRSIDENSDMASRVEMSATRWIQAHRASQQGITLMRTMRAFAKRSNNLCLIQGAHQ
jgi:O-antigen biosynthesis alpha-1,2-mannosyltransferase